MINQANAIPKNVLKTVTTVLDLTLVSATPDTSSRKQQVNVKKFQFVHQIASGQVRFASAIQTTAGTKTTLPAFSAMLPNSKFLTVSVAFAPMGMSEMPAESVKELLFRQHVALMSSTTKI